MQYKDIELVCGCGKSFVFTVGEQKFFEGRKDDNGQPFRPPKRCRECRAKKNEAKIKTPYVEKIVWDEADQLAGKKLRSRPFKDEFVNEFVEPDIKEPDDFSGAGPSWEDR